MDHVVGARKQDLERISDPKNNAINPTELFGNTKLVDIFPKSKNIVTVQESDSLSHALSLIAQNGILSLPVYSKSKKGYNKFLDVLDIVTFIQQELKKKGISEQEAAKLSSEELAKKIGFDTATVQQVATLNESANYYQFEGSAPSRAALDRICKNNLRRVPIVSGEGELYGICSQTDLIMFVNLHKRLFEEFNNKSLRELNLGFHKVQTIKNTETILHAFSVIHESHISGVGVVDDGGKLVGVVSGSDTKLIGIGNKDIHKLCLPYNQVVLQQRPPVTVKAEDSFGTVIDKFIKEHVHRLFIVDNNNAPIGVISQIDVLKLIQSSLK